MNVDYNPEPWYVAYVGNLKYGAAVTGVSAYPGACFMKIDMILTPTPEDCVLVDLKSGSVRLLNRNELVTVCEATVKMSLARSLYDHLKRNG